MLVKFSNEKFFNYYYYQISCELEIEKMNGKKHLK